MTGDLHEAEEIVQEAAQPVAGGAAAVSVQALALAQALRTLCWYASAR